MDEEAGSLRKLFASAKAQKEALEAPNNNRPAYEDQLNSAIKAFESCQKVISQLSIFSPNESLEEISTTDLQFLTVDYLLAELLQRLHGAHRLNIAERTREHYNRFLELSDQYGILSPADKKLHEQYLESPETFSLASQNDAAARRQIKINRFREEKELKQKLEYLSKNREAIVNDDEIARQIYLADIALCIHRTFQALDLLSQELVMLKLASRNAVERPGHVPLDPRILNRNDNSGYSDRLDVGLSSGGRGRGGPLLSKTGVPLQPFVLTSKRSDIRSGVFRPGHNLPTMTIEDYLEEEKRRGGIIEGGGEKSGLPKEIDEDDMEKADEETMKARAWDEFKEQNPKGSGNTLNRG